MKLVGVIGAIALACAGVSGVQADTPSPTVTATPTPGVPTLEGPLQAGGPGYLFTGTALPGEAVAILDNGVLLGTGNVGALGRFAIHVRSANLNDGDSVCAAGGGALGPESEPVTVGPALSGAPTAAPVPLDGGATFATVDAAPGSWVRLIDRSTGAILSQKAAAARGQTVMQLAGGILEGDRLEFTCSGLAPASFVAGASGQAASLQDSSQMLNGGTVLAKGKPGATIQLLGDSECVVAQGVADSQGIAALELSGASFPGTLLLVQNGYVSPGGQALLSQGRRSAWLNVNTFRPAEGTTLTVGFEASQTGNVEVRVFDLSGRLVRFLGTFALGAGAHGEAFWDGGSDGGAAAASGIYLVSVRGAGLHTILKVIVIK